MGFTADCRLRQELSGLQFDQFIDEFIDQAIEARSLVFGGGGSLEHGWTGVICRDGRYRSTTDTDRTAVRHWLEQRPEIRSFRLSEFWDIWHEPNPFDRENTEQAAA